MNAEDRKLVLWIGDVVPESFVAELRQRGGLDVRTIAERDLSKEAPSARTLLLEFDGEVGLFVARVRRAQPIALTHGLGIGLVYRQDSQLSAFVRVSEKFDQDHSEINLQNSSRNETRIISFIPQDWIATAEWSARYNPGPGANRTIRLKGTVKDLDEEQRTLLQRSFGFADEIYLTQLTGGYSDARVFKVRAVGPGVRRRLAYFAKIDSSKKLVEEIGRYETFVTELVPFDQRPNLHSRLFAFGNTKAVLAGDFVDHAIPLADLFGAFKPEGIISNSLLYGALEEWRFNAPLADLPLFQKFRDLKVLRPANELKADDRKARAESIEQAQKHGHCIPEDDLWKIIESLPSTETRYCTIHGDLHAANILVRVSPLNTFLIDFSKTQEGPAVADPASLEVSLSFRFNEQFDVNFLSKLYRYPCSVPDETIHSYENESLLEIVQSIRRSGCWNEKNCFAYVFALAAYLFGVSSYSTYMLEKRALAYYLSQKLFRDLQDTVREN